MPATATPQQFREHTIAEGQLQVDRENKVIRGVKILGRTSKNGRTYTQKSMGEACGFYQGRDVYIDHPAKGEENRERSLADGFGELRECVVKAEGVFGDLHYIEAHPLCEMILERAERGIGVFGLSHNAVGTLSDKTPAGGPDVVESIDAVHSVDVVTRPATNNNLFESERPETMKKKTIQAVLKENRDKDKKAKALFALLEMDEEMAAVATEAPEVEESNPADEMKAGIEAMVLAVIRDDDLDATAKIAKIRQILNAGAKIEEKPAEGGGEGGGESSEPKEEETVESLRAELRRDRLQRDLLEEVGITRGSLTAAQRKLLDGQSDEEGMRSLIESWPKSTREKKPAITTSKRQLRESRGDDGLDYESLRSRVSGK